MHFQQPFYISSIFCLECITPFSVSCVRPYRSIGDRLHFFYHILLILLLAKVLLQKNSVFDWIFLAGLFYLCYKSYQYNYDFYNIFGTMMFLCCAKNIEIKKIAKRINTKCKSIISNQNFYWMKHKNSHRTTKIQHLS